MKDDEPITDDLRTLFGVRIRRDHIQLWRDIWHLLLIFLGMAIFFGACGVMRYISCDVNNEQKSTLQCLFPELVKNDPKPAKRK